MRMLAANVPHRHQKAAIDHSFAEVSRQLAVIRLLHLVQNKVPSEKMPENEQDEQEAGQVARLLKTEHGEDHQVQLCVSEKTIPRPEKERERSEIYLATVRHFHPFTAGDGQKSG